jgi:hypothetical protein
MHGVLQRSVHALCLPCLCGVYPFRPYQPVWTSPEPPKENVA